MNVESIFLLLLLCCVSWCLEYGLNFQNKDAYLQASFITVCDESRIKFEVLINRESGVVFYAVNKIKSVTLITYFERPGIYLNITDGLTKYSLPLTLDFFSSEWTSWHDIELRLSEHKMHLFFDNNERQITIQTRFLFPEDSVEENEVYFGASPDWSRVGNVTRFSGLMRNIKYKSCGCNEWKPIKILKVLSVSMDNQGECKASDACKRDCTCYLFSWGGKRCECPKKRCAESNDEVSFKFDEADQDSGRLRPSNMSHWSSSDDGPFGRSFAIEPRNRLRLFVAKGRTCFKNIFLCESGFFYRFWLLASVNTDPDRKSLILKHASSINSVHGITVTRQANKILTTLVTRDGTTYNVQAPLTLSMWSHVTILYNQSSFSIQIDSLSRYSTEKYIDNRPDLLDLSMSTRFLFIGNSQDDPGIQISDWLFSTDMSLAEAPSIKELRLEQHNELRKTNVPCKLFKEGQFVNIADCVRIVFGDSPFNIFHVSMIVSIPDHQVSVLIRSPFISVRTEASHDLLVDVDGMPLQRVTLTRTINNLSYLEISVNELGELTVIQSMNIVLLNITMALGPKNTAFNRDMIGINGDSRVLRFVRILNTIRNIGARTKRIITKEISRYSVDFGPGDLNHTKSLPLINGIVDRALLLKLPTTHVTVPWFKKSCVRYIASCYHGLSISLWIKLLNPFQNVDDKYFQLFSSGKKGLSLFMDTGGRFFVLVIESRVARKFVPANPITLLQKWTFIEISVSQNEVPFLYIDRQETQRLEFPYSYFPNQCDGICIGDEMSRDIDGMIGVDELHIWDVDRQFLYANEYVSAGPSGHKLISFTNYQLKDSFTMHGSAQIISTRYGYGLALNNFGPRYAAITLSRDSTCLWNLDDCRRGITIRVWLRPDNLAVSYQTILASPFVVMTINMQYLSTQMTARGKTWLVISKDLLHLFKWHLVEISWHWDGGLRTLIDGKLVGHAREGSRYTGASSRVASSLSVGIDYRTMGNVNYATLLIDDIELFDADRSALATELHPGADQSCAILFNFDDALKSAIPPVLGIVGSAGLFNSTVSGVTLMSVPSCFNYHRTGCVMCFTLRMWLNVYKYDTTVLRSGFITLAVSSKELKVNVGDIVGARTTSFSCSYGDARLLNKWRFMEISWDNDEGLVVFLNREAVTCALGSGVKVDRVGVFDSIEISNGFTGAIDEIELYHARLSELYRRNVINESMALGIIDALREKEKIQKEVVLLKQALDSATLNRSVEVVDSFQVNGSNYVSYKLPQHSYPYIPGGREEVEISFKSFSSQQNSIIWISDSLLSKNTLTLKNRKLYFTKVYVQPSSNTSERLTEELEIHNNILPNIIYNVKIYQRAGEIVMKTTSVNESNIQSMIGRDPLLPMDSEVYFGGYNNLKFLKFNQINSSLHGIIYKARLKSGSSEKAVDILQEMVAAKRNPNIGNQNNVLVQKKIIKVDEPQKASFLAILSYTKVPLMIANPFFSLGLPEWDFNILTSIEIEFSTFESRGLLLFIGNMTDFISLELFDSQLFFVYKMYRSYKRIRVHGESIRVSNNKPISIYLGRDLSGSTKVYFNRDEVIGSVIKVREFAHSVSVIGHLGKYERWPTEVLSRTSFVGCLHFVRINDGDYVNFRRKSSLMKYEDFNLYPGMPKAQSYSYRSDICEAPPTKTCDASPCEGGWCQLTSISAMLSLENNFKCNCLLSSRSLVNGFSGTSIMQNFDQWIYEYLLQSRSKPCSADTKQYVIVDQSFFTATFKLPFPFVSILDVEFLVLLKSADSCLLEVVLRHSSMSIIISNGRVSINIAETNVVTVEDVNLYDHQWHDIHLQVRLQSGSIKVGNVRKEFESPSIPTLIVSALKVGACGGVKTSHFKIKGLTYNSLDVFNTELPGDATLFYSTKYHYPEVTDINRRSPSLDRPITFLNNLQRAQTRQTMTLTWLTQFLLSMSSLYTGAIVKVVNGEQFLSFALCLENTMIIYHRNHLKQSKIKRVQLNQGKISFTFSIDLIRDEMKMTMSNGHTIQILGLGIDSWSVGDVVNVVFGVSGFSSDMMDLTGIGHKEQYCLHYASLSILVGCLETFVWSDGNKAVSFTGSWEVLMETTPSTAVMTRQCRAVEKCGAKTCVNGVCRSLDHITTFCDCSNTEFTGPRCDSVKDKCSEHICVNNGRCMSTTTSVYCDCSGTGYSGSRCEILMCPDDYCANKGRCYTVSNSLFCDCNATRFGGSKCDVPVCRSQMCSNRGLCMVVSNTTSPICHCSPGYFGEYCEVDSVTKCPKKCRNDGVCSIYQPMLKLCSHGYCRRSNSFQCSCDHTFYQGEYCEQAERGFDPIKDGVLVMQNITNEPINYLRILFERDSIQNESTLATIVKSVHTRLVLMLVNDTLLLKYTNTRGAVSFVKDFGVVSKVNVLLIGEQSTRVDYYLNNKMGYIDFADPSLGLGLRYRRSAVAYADVPGAELSPPYIIIGGNEAMQKCFNGLIAGVTWNDQRFMDPRNILYRDGQRLPLSNALVRAFPRQDTYLALLFGNYGYMSLIAVAVVLIIFVFTFYISRRLWCKSCGRRKVYHHNGKSSNHKSLTHHVDLDSASEMALITPKLAKETFAMEEQSPDLSSHDNSKLIFKSISSSISSETEYCRLLLITNIDSLHNLNVIDYAMLPDNQIVISVNYLPEIKICQNLFPVDADDMVYKCVEVHMSPIGHYIYCYMSPCQTIRGDEYELQAWRIGASYDLLTRPPNVTFSHAVPFADRSLRLMLLDNITCKLSLYDMEYGTVLWTRAMSNYYHIPTNPLVLTGDSSRLIVNKELCFDVINAGDGVMRNTYMIPHNASVRQIVAMDRQTLTILTDGFDLYHWDCESEVFDHQQLPIRVTVVERSRSVIGGRVGLGLETGEVYISMGEDGNEYLPLGPRNNKNILSMRFSLDATMLAAAFDNNLVHIWRLESGVPLCHFHAIHERGEVLNLDFTSDNTRLLVLVVTNRARPRINKKILIMPIRTNNG